MTRRCCLIGMLGIWVAALGSQSQPAVFRAEADSVTVNVSVKKGNQPVQGLTASEFRLFDNDVQQEVAAVSMDAIPVDVSFVVETSYKAFPDMGKARDAIRGMAAFLRLSDRFRVLTTGNAVVSTIPWRNAGVPDVSAIQMNQGQIALVSDAVFMALFHRSSPDRRHLVVALTEGHDWCSLVSGNALTRGAERSGAVFHWVSLQPRPGLGTHSEMNLPYGADSFCRTQSSFVGDKVDLRPSLSEAVRLTGGMAHTAWYSFDRIAIDAFDEIFADFRRSYILHYVPRGVERTGWHRLRVEMVKKGYTLRARTGYWADAAAATPAR